MQDQQVCRFHEWIMYGLQLHNIQATQSASSIAKVSQNSRQLEHQYTNNDNDSRNRTVKTLCLGKYFECTEEAKFIVVVAKLALIFNINMVTLAQSLQNIGNRQMEYIADFPLENILADTNRKQFAKFLHKIIEPPVTIQTTICKLATTNIGYLTIIIQNLQAHKQKNIISNNNSAKFLIKFFNWEQYLHCIVSNVGSGELLSALQKYIETKYRKIKMVICYQRVASEKLNINVYSLLARKFEDIVYFCYHASNQQPQLPRLKCDNNLSAQLADNSTIYINYSDSILLISSYLLAQSDIQKLVSIIRKYQRINYLISFPLKSKSAAITQPIFYENQFCVSMYGAIYNFIVNLNIQNCESIGILRLMIELLIINKSQHENNKAEKQGKRITNRRKLGHYPINIDKGSKVCCVCELSKKKKSRFKCEKCSQSYSRDIALCLDHFKEYHDNVHKYIPKGVRRGAYQNELQQLNEKVDGSSGSRQQKAHHALQMIEKLSQKIDADAQVLDMFGMEIEQRKNAKNIVQVKKQEQPQPQPQPQPQLQPQVKEEEFYYPTIMPGYYPGPFPHFYP